MIPSAPCCLFSAHRDVFVSTSDEETEDFLPDDDAEEERDGFENGTATSANSSPSSEHSRHYSTPKSTLPRQLLSPYGEDGERGQVSGTILAKSALNNYKYVPI